MIHLLSQFAATCGKGGFFGFPAWHEYLQKDDAKSAIAGTCQVNFELMKNGKFGQDILLVGLAGIDILIRIAAIIAVGYVIYGGIKYITSQGSPDNLKNAQNTILHALIGVSVAVMAAAIVGFIGRTIV